MTQANPTLPKPIADALTLIHTAQSCATLAIGQLDRPEERDRVSASITALRTMIDSAARYIWSTAPKPLINLRLRQTSPKRRKTARR
jgi:hypothetical protein